MIASSLVRPSGAESQEWGPLVAGVLVKGGQAFIDQFFRYALNSLAARPQAVGAP